MREPSVHAALLGSVEMNLESLINAGSSGLELPIFSLIEPYKQKGSGSRIEPGRIFLRSELLKQIDYAVSYISQLCAIFAYIYDKPLSTHLLFTGPFKIWLTNEYAQVFHPPTRVPLLLRSVQAERADPLRNPASLHAYPPE